MNSLTTGSPADDPIEKMTNLAEEILTNARNELLVNLRFLDVALNQLLFAPVSEDSTLSTDGAALYFSPYYVLVTYSWDQRSITRSFLHMVLHCVFRHMFGAVNMQKDLWDLACDIAVEATISNLGLKNTASQKQQEQQSTIDALEKELGSLTAEKVYRYYRDNPISAADRESVSLLFSADDHILWYGNTSHTKNILVKEGRKKKPDKDGRSNTSVVPELTKDPASTEKLSDIWKDISEKMQMDLKTFSKDHDDAAASLIQNLEELSREAYDYREFLRKFAVRREFMQINDDEFDYILYTYGLKLYDKVPLIEPLEYKEEKRISEFVIAIDTSGSVSGPLVQTFVQNTWNILKSSESFFKKINLHIIQCDADIQEHVKITDQRSFDEYIDKMEIKGLGGTDFRPVFDLVEKLRREKELTDLKGMIYFTDGNGEFPYRRPDYDVACIFIEGAHNSFRVPPWVIRLILRKEDIENLSDH